MKIFKLPDLGEGLAEAEIVRWYVSEGETVKQDQPLVAVETAKAVVDVPSPRDGRIARCFGAAGDILHINDALVEFDQGTQAPQQPTDTPRPDSGTVVGSLEAAKGVEKQRLTSSGRGGRTAVKATPAVRAMAQKLDVDLSVVTPSGPDGLITAADVQRVAKILKEAGPLEPLRGVRRAMAHNMAAAHAQVVPVTLVDEADVESWVDGGDITLRLVRALVAGCRAEPALNAWYDGHAVGRRVLKQVHLGVAVDSSDGLFVAVLREADSRDEGQLRSDLNQLKEQVKSRQVPPERLRGYTITLSNFGTIAGRHATPIVLPPTVAILGAGRIRPEVRAVEGQVQVRRVLPLSLTFDHRAVTGGEAGRFLAAVMADLERG